MLSGKVRRPKARTEVQPAADERYDAVEPESLIEELSSDADITEKVEEDRLQRQLSTASSQETLDYPLSPKYEDDGGTERGALRYAASPRSGLQTSSDDRILRRGNKRKIILITIVTAGIPLLLGSIFFASLGLNAPSGRYEGGYFIRSKDETVSLYVGTELLNPLLLASVISTIISILPPFCLSLVAFHLGHQWIEASGLHGPGRNSKLMTPYQHSLLLSIGAMASEWSLLDFLRYWLLRTPSRRPNFIRRSTRAVIPTPLATGAISLFLVLLLSYFIKVVDIVLHKEITSTVILQAERNGTYQSSFALKPECINPDRPGCPIAARSTLGFQAAANLSDVFRAMPMGNVINALPNLSIMALPPTTDTIWDYNANTIAVSATCTVRRPICSVENQEVRVCWPMNGPEEDLFYATVQDQPLTPDIQLFQAPYPGGKAFNGPSIGGTATQRSPSHVFGWSCFPNYGNVSYSDSDASFPTPFVNWFMIGQGISPNVLLCSIMACDIGIHKLEYTLRNGTLGVLESTAQKADNATILTVTDVLPYSTYEQTATNNETFVDSMIYRYTRKLIDAQLQTAITSAGMVGNDTIAFQNQVAQSISNLLVSWAAGAVEAGPSISAARNAPLLAVKIPLSWSFLFIASLYLFTILIILLGISCLLLPTVYTKTDENVVKHGQSYRVAVPEVDIARLRFTDISTIVHELIPQDGRSARLDAAEMFQEGSGREYHGHLDRTSTYSTNSTAIPETVILRRKKTRAEKELKTVLVHEDDEMRLKIEGR